MSLTLRRVLPTRVLVVAGCALGASPLLPVAHAQDSVSTASGLPGDATDAYQNTTGNSRQVLRYVVDLTPHTSSWAGKYAMGPAVKASKSNAGGYFDQLIGAQAVSARFKSGSFFSTGVYLEWMNLPGAGVNTPQNSAPPNGLSGAIRFGQRFGLGFMEFGAGVDGVFGTGDDENNLIGSEIDFQHRQPNRLFVQRVVAATNKSAVTCAGPTPCLGTASFGLGGIDENGALHAYAEGYAMTSAQRVSTRALLRVNLGARGINTLNQIQGSGSNVVPGDAPAVETVRTNVVAMTAPAIISANAPGGAARPVMLSTDLTNNYVYESAANVTSTSTAYLTGSSGSPRGSVCFIPQVYAPTAAASPVGTAASLARTDTNLTTRAIQIFGVSSAGAPGTVVNLTLPATAGALVDADDAFAPGTAFSPITAHEFTNYASQASFRGGTSQVAMLQLAGGDLLVAATVAVNGGGSTIPQTQDGYIAVARLPAAGGAPAWTIAAHTGASGFAGTGGNASKTIFGRATVNDPLAPIGRLAKYSEVFGSASNGPSISSPAFDRAGNVYFMATIGLTGSTTTFTTGLLRANFDSATNAYKLELLASVGDILAGANSGRTYQVQFLGVADADSIDSGSIFSSATVRDAISGASASPAYGSPMSLGALVFRAKIVYDVNADTLFADPSGAGSGSTSPDQAYNVAMVLMPRVPRGDANRDQTLAVGDIFEFLNLWFASGVGADWNGDGTIAIGDIFDFLNDWFLGN